MREDTLDTLERLRDEREGALRAYESAAKAFGEAVASSDLPVQQIASELGISRQAVYQLREKYAD